ncbi:MAG: cytochrome b/b6 domain-containing protein [Microbacterium sp.]|uniref:cytochrome b/b6 domain-containing protein n=1 Tax=Microbacterium sp. TaxID=51671 RepID=UPI003A843A9E
MVAASETPLRRGLPRTAGGEPWPAAGFAPVLVAAGGGPSTGSGSEGAGSGSGGVAPLDERTLSLPKGGERSTADGLEVQVPAVVTTAARDTSAPLAGPRTVVLTSNAARWNAERVARQGKGPVAEPEPKRYGPFTKIQWFGAVVIAGAGLLIAAALAVVFVRWFLSLGFMQDFLTAFPGEYHLPEGAPVGFPAWLGWQHFFNVFLMVLIIRSGLRIRTEKRPTAFWTPRRDPKGKVSLTIWFHQSLDILWLVNGVVFVVLLFVTGQWMRVIPTSWEVFPNALSAVLQYISLDWPTENGWVNYNSVQQLTYFATIFLAAPLAALTGWRMSGMWPKNAKGLNKAYPIEWARAVHFPVMLYFVAFIAVHVFLVFATGALRNLNHMYAAQGSVDPNAYADNWTGFWFFVASVVVIAAAWVTARPLTLAPIARLFGTVSAR